MVDGIVDQSVTGAIEYEGEYYKVDSGKIDTSYNGPWTCGKTTYYLVNGHTNKNMTGIVKYGNGWYFVNNGIVFIMVRLIGIIQSCTIWKYLVLYRKWSIELVI